MDLQTSGGKPVTSDDALSANKLPRVFPTDSRRPPATAGHPWEAASLESGQSSHGGRFNLDAASDAANG